MFATPLLPLFAQAGAPGPDAKSLIIYVLGFGAIIYFVMWRPQQKQARETSNMLSALKKGDDVVTSGGLLGRIFAVDEKVVTLEVGGGVKLRVLKQSIQGKVNVEAAKTDAPEAKKEEK